MLAQGNARNADFPAASNAVARNPPYSLRDDRLSFAPARDPNDSLKRTWQSWSGRGGGRESKSF